MQPAHPLDVLGEVVARGAGQHGEAILVALAAPNGVLVAVEVDVLDAQVTALEQAHAGAAEQDGHQVRHAIDLRQDGTHLVA